MKNNNNIPKSESHESVGQKLAIEAILKEYGKSGIKDDKKLLQSINKKISLLKNKGRTEETLQKSSLSNKRKIYYIFGSLSTIGVAACLAIMIFLNFDKSGYDNLNQENIDFYDHAANPLIVNKKNNESIKSNVTTLNNPNNEEDKNAIISETNEKSFEKLRDEYISLKKSYNDLDQKLKNKFKLSTSSSKPVDWSLSIDKDEQKEDVGSIASEKAKLDVKIKQKRFELNERIKRQNLPRQDSQNAYYTQGYIGAKRELTSKVNKEHESSTLKNSDYQYNIDQEADYFALPIPSSSNKINNKVKKNYSNIFLKKHLKTLKLKNSLDSFAPMSDMDSLEPMIAMETLTTRNRIIPNPYPGHRSSRGERYGELIDNEFKNPIDEPQSTFSIDVDTASYTNIRNKITNGYHIQPDSVRIEEMINYFDYNYKIPKSKNKQPFSVNVLTGVCPWNKDHLIAKIGLQAYKVPESKRKNANLVFLIDVSGSMNNINKLPMLKESMRHLVNKMKKNDRISIVTYAGSEKIALEPTSGNEKEKILKVLDNLQASGSTNGEGGIKVAYKLAEKNFLKHGLNRVILATDGDFNVGASSDKELVNLITKKSKKKIFLNVLGFGHGNLNDSMLEKITNKGNGVYFYIDSLREGRKVFNQKIVGTLTTVAKDVKLQVEFNPEKVYRYRLIGYANRKLRNEDFDNDKIDAGDIGAGHQVTALYQIEPHSENNKPYNPNLRYQIKDKKIKKEKLKSNNNEIMFVKMRYKLPNQDKSKKIEFPVIDRSEELLQGVEKNEDIIISDNEDFNFATAVAGFGLMLRDSKYAENIDFELIFKLANNGMTNKNNLIEDENRQEFISLINLYKNYKKNRY